MIKVFMSVNTPQLDHNNTSQIVIQLKTTVQHKKILHKIHSDNIVK